MSKDRNPPSKPGDYEKLKKKLAIEEGKSHLKAYPGYPVDDKDHKISEKKTSETVKHIAGKDLGKGFHEIRDQKRLASQYGGQPNDWVKLSSKPRDVNDGIDKKAKPWEVHGYRNSKTGQVEELKAVDVNKRSAEKKAASQKKENMDKTTGKKDLPQKGELSKKFNEKANGMTGNKKTETKAETPKRGDLKEKFQKAALSKKETGKKGDSTAKAELKPKPDKPRLG